MKKIKKIYIIYIFFKKLISNTISELILFLLWNNYKYALFILIYLKCML